MKILKYKEYINTECSNVKKSILTTKAIKVDGNNSFKMAIKCGDLKSCDYLRYKKDKFFLIEISNLNTQLVNLSKELNNQNISMNNISKSTKKKLKPMNIIQNELKEKITQTILILNELVKVVKFNIDKIKIFIVALCITSKSDIMIFDKIKKDLKRQWKIIVDDIIFVPTIELERLL